MRALTVSMLLLLSATLVVAPITLFSNSEAEEEEKLRLLVQGITPERWTTITPSGWTATAPTNVDNIPKDIFCKITNSVWNRILLTLDTEKYKTKVSGRAKYLQTTLDKLAPNVLQFDTVSKTYSVDCGNMTSKKALYLTMLFRDFWRRYMKRFTMEESPMAGVAEPLKYARGMLIYLEQIGEYKGKVDYTKW